MKDVCSVDDQVYRRAFGDAVRDWEHQDAMRRAAPMCRRCGRSVERVVTGVTPDLGRGALKASFLCHGDLHQIMLSRAALERGDLAALWPTHVFDYATESFGSFDANGSPVEAA